MENLIPSGMFQIDADIQWEDLGNGIKRQLFGYNDQVMMVKVKFEQGAIGTLHQHPHIQVSYVESGIFELTIDGEKRSLKQGDGYFVLPNLLHGAVCIEPGVLIDVFTPHREDFLPR